MTTHLKPTGSYPGVYILESDKKKLSNNHNKHFYIRYRAGKKAMKEMVGTSDDGMTAFKASLIRAEKIQSQDKKRFDPKSDIRNKSQSQTFDQLLQSYLQLKSIKAEHQDVSRYKKHIKPIFGNRRPESIDFHEFVEFKEIISIGRKPATIRNILELFRRISNFAKKHRLSKGLSFPVEMPTVNNLKTEDLTDDELKRLLRAIDEDHDIQIRNLMKLALYTGMRRGELFRLEWRDISFEYMHINIKDSKSGRDEYIPMNQTALTILMNHPRTECSSLVFPSKNGKKRVDVRKSVDRIKKRAGLSKDFRGLHGLRHVFASRLASSGGIELYRIQKLLTHKSSQMTSRYAHLNNQSLRSASKIMDEIK